MVLFFIPLLTTATERSHPKGLLLHVLSFAKPYVAHGNKGVKENNYINFIIAKTLLGG
jgi:hypothetical protein